MKRMNMFSKREKLSNNTRNILYYAIIGIFLSVGLISCGGSGSGPVQAPKAFIQDFIAKHQTMADASLAELYVEEEKAQVAELVDQSISSLKALGTLETLQQATFDFSNLQLEVLGEKEEYVNDEPKTFIKVAVKGSYTMNQKDVSKTIPADDIIILKMVGNNWKVTETVNPWS